jgi:F420-non-reducing hydrogenase small subunit
MIKLATESLSSCQGCHVAIVDLNEKILKVFEHVQLVKCGVLMDEKGTPEADIGLIEGAIRTDHDRHVLEEARKKYKTCIAFGTCAVFGGISGAGDVFTPEQIMEKVYKQSPTTVPSEFPSQNLPKMETGVLPVDQVAKMDLYLPGCPPHPFYIFDAISALIEGRAPNMGKGNVCSSCKRKMVKSDVSEIKRELDGIPDPEKCFLSQGYICMGSVTMDRCLAPCPNEGVICTGCVGPSMNIIVEPNRDIRTELASRISSMTKIPYDKALKAIEEFSRTFYAYVMASPYVKEKPTFLIRKWMKEAEEAKA